MTARRFIISGRVQGVGYRYFALRAAEWCGIVGTARNLPDGTVEVVAQGDEAAVGAFRAHLERGPSFGRVDRIVEEPAPPAAHDTFRITH
jgi:acylphosphatase